MKIPAVIQMQPGENGAAALCMILGYYKRFVSLEEMRKELIAGRRLNIHRNSDPEGVEFMQGYWAKNLYWFSVHMTYGYDLEGLRIIPDTYVHLVPPGYDIPAKHRRWGDKITTNAAAFWQG